MRGGMHRGEDTDRQKETNCNREYTGDTVGKETQEAMEVQNIRHSKTQHKDMNLEP